MKLTLTLTELRKTAISVQAVAVANKLGFDTDQRVLTLARTLKKAFEGHVLNESGETVSDMIELLKGSQKLLEEHKKVAFAEANGNPEKQNYLFNEKISLDDRITDYAQRERDLFSKKIEVEITPVKVDLEAVEIVQQYLHKDDKEYVFDMQLVFPAQVEVEFMGSSMYKNPLTEFTNLVVDGFIELIEPEETPAQKLKNKVNSLKS